MSTKIMCHKGMRPPHASQDLSACVTASLWGTSRSACMVCRAPSGARRQTAREAGERRTIRRDFCIVAWLPSAHSWA